MSEALHAEVALAILDPKVDCPGVRAERRSGGKFLGQVEMLELGTTFD